jgi:hypothetical protein
MRKAFRNIRPRGDAVEPVEGTGHDSCLAGHCGADESRRIRKGFVVEEIQCADTDPGGGKSRQILATRVVGQF